MKTKLTLATVLAAEFAPAFDKLADETSISMKDRYAVSRVLADIKSSVSAYDTERIKLVKQYGKPEQDVLKAQLLRVAGSAQEAQVKARIERLEKSGEQSWTIDPADEKAMAQFREKIEELQAVEFEVYLDHAIPLTDASKLTAKDIAALGALVTVN